MEFHRKFLTASNFGRVCNMLQRTSCTNIVKLMLYSSFNNIAMKYGCDNEEKVKTQLKKYRNIITADYGLFIDSVYPFLGATPDGIFDREAGNVEIEYPYSVWHLTPKEAIRNRKVTALKVTADGANVRLKERHQWYLQIKVNSVSQEKSTEERYRHQKA